MGQQQPTDALPALVSTHSLVEFSLDPAHALLVGFPVDDPRHLFVAATRPRPCTVDSPHPLLVHPLLAFCQYNPCVALTALRHPGLGEHCARLKKKRRTANNKQTKTLLAFAHTHAHTILINILLIHAFPPTASIPFFSWVMSFLCGSEKKKKKKTKTFFANVVQTIIFCFVPSSPFNPAVKPKKLTVCYWRETKKQRKEREKGPTVPARRAAARGKQKKRKTPQSHTTRFH